MKNVYRPLIQLVALTSLLVSSIAMAGNIFRWVDENGVAHYGDSPAIGAEPVLVRNGKPVPPPRSANTDDAPDEEKMAAIRQSQCEKARKRYRQFNDSDKIVETDEFGKKRELSPEERLTTIAKAKGDVEAYCDEG